MRNKFLYIIAIASVITCIGIVSCKRDYSTIAEYNVPSGTAYLRIVHAAPYFRNIFNVPDSFNVLVAGTKVTAYLPANTPLMTYGSIFPMSGTANGYVSVPAGDQQIKLSLGVNNPDSVTIKQFTKTLLPDTYYTLMITDSINSNRDAAQMFVKDSFSIPGSGYYNLRFIHAVWEDVATSPKNVDTIDIFSTRNNRIVFSKITPGTVTAYSQFAYNAQLNDTFYVRRVRSSTNIDTLNSASFSNQRTYTLYYKGDATIKWVKDPHKTAMGVYLNK